jgi:2-C-methyl-D-erythritol 2,4-cyclodiphosphate synthase
MSPEAASLRCGIGYDTHWLVEGRKLVLGGVEIASPRGPQAHSDGDVLCHAIADALLGAAGLGDLGQRFPDSDPRWKNASSLVFLETIRELLASSGFRILHIDSVVVLDEPKLAPHIWSTIKSIAGALQLEPHHISVKAKTTEGISPDVAAAHAVVLLSGTPVRT